MNDLLIDDQCNQFADQLGDLIGTALLNRLPVFRIASTLLQTTVILAAGFEINPDDLLADLNDFAGMDNNHHDRLH